MDVPVDLGEEVESMMKVKLHNLYGVLIVQREGSQ